MRKVKTKTVPLKAMDFIQDAYDIKNYIYIMKKIGNRILHLMK